MVNRWKGHGTESISESIKNKPVFGHAYLEHFLCKCHSAPTATTPQSDRVSVLLPNAGT